MKSEILADADAVVHKSAAIVAAEARAAGVFRGFRVRRSWGVGCTYWRDGLCRRYVGTLNERDMRLLPSAEEFRKKLGFKAALPTVDRYALPASG